MPTKWIRKGGFEEASHGILSNAPGRARLVQHRATETPKMIEPQEYTEVLPDGTRIAPRGGGIPTVGGPDRYFGPDRPGRSARRKRSK